MRSLYLISHGVRSLHSAHDHGGLGEWLHSSFGEVGHFIDEVLLHALVDTLKVLPFLFLTYLLMEFIEHKAQEKTVRFMQKAGSLGPLVGGAVGLVPQCGFSSVAANLFSGRIVTVGTLIAVFLATSDEMLPILLGSSVPTKTVVFILVYKAFCAILVGFATDLVIRLCLKSDSTPTINDLCNEDGCHCEKGILRSAIHHTVHISLFILAFTLVINLAVFFIGDERMDTIMHGLPVLSHLIAAVFGLIPNCAASVALTSFYTSGYITLGTMLSGLFSGAGIGVLVLFRMNRSLKQNLIILAILIFSGALFGAIADLTGLASVFI